MGELYLTLIEDFEFPLTDNITALCLNLQAILGNSWQFQLRFDDFGSPKGFFKKLPQP